MSNSNTYQQCKRCIMDTSDPEIVFDEQGVCNHCRKFDKVTSKHWFPNEEGNKRWTKVVEQLKASGKGREYDCIIGLSGGVDSSYLALKIHESGLRPLVVHVDAGWNSELAMANIESIIKHCNYDLHTHVVDWEEMKGLHLAYLRAGISNQDVPQDHIFFSSLYHFAIKNKIRHILSGSNFATESIFPDAWLGDAMDAINLRAIHKKYGENKLKHYKTISFFEYYIWYPFVKRMSIVNPLNYMAYDKAKALEELKTTVGYKPYARKHGESQFTKLFQNYYLPQKFGFDKRQPHLSSLIVSGQITRDEALQKLKEPLYEPDELERDISFFCKKLQITRETFNELMNAPVHEYSDFPSFQNRYKLLKKIQSVFERILGRRFGFYYK
jgi:aminotransferase